MPVITPFLSFDGKAVDAAKLYTKVFKGSEPTISKIAAQFEIGGMTVTGLNGGPQFKFSQALSFFVWCETEEEIAQIWQGLNPHGEIRMELNAYPWAKKYGWVADKFGVEWQLMLSRENQNQKIMPAFLFVKDLFGKGEEAVKFYISQFENSKIEMMSKDPATNTIAHCQFSLDGQYFVLMEGAGIHDFTFTPAFSFVVNCETQQEVDNYWMKLSEGGSTGQCGWLTDKFGVPWQVVPTVLKTLLSNPINSDSVMKAMLKMTKLDIALLKQAAIQQ